MNLGYVVNVIEDPDERTVVLAAAWNFARKLLIVSARLDWEATDAAIDFTGTASSPASAPSRSFFTQEELRQWIESVLGRPPIAAAPGIFYVFRDDADEQSFAVNRVARQRRLPAIEQCQDLVAEHREAIEPLIAFVTERGRLPVDGELSTAPKLTQLFGSVARAFSLIRRASNSDHWDQIRQARLTDVLVYLALAAFPKRPRFGALPDDLRHDIRAFFGSYRAGCAEADALLFSAGDPDAVDRACRDAPIGKLLPDALYGHRTAVEHLSPVLRVLEGCARQLAGTVDGVTLVKLFRRARLVSRLRGLRPGGAPGPPKRSRRRPEAARHPLS